MGRASEGSPLRACVISKKTAARATVRNKAKRRCRAALHDALKGVREPRALAVHIKTTALDASFSELKNDMAELIRRVHGS